MRVYISSKLKYAAKWRIVRDSGINVISTWIDNPEIPDNAQDMSALWSKIIAEASMADILLVYRQNSDEQLKGGFIELGAALANGATIYAVGFNDHTFIHHPNVTIFSTLDDALIAIESEMKEEEDRELIQPEPTTFEEELRSLINRHSVENGSMTPDFILAGHIRGYLDLFGVTMKTRDDWYGLNKTSTLHQLGEEPIQLEEPNLAVLYFKNAVETDSVRYYQKTGKVRVRPAEEGKEYVTEIKGEVETKITAKKGDFEVEGASGEIYILSLEKLNARYVWISNEDGWNIYEAIGRTYAVVYQGDTMKFKAPWGEEMLCNSGDYICSPSTKEFDDIYRIERETFLKTYQPLPRGLR